MDDNISPGANSRLNLYTSSSATPLAVWGGIGFVSGGSEQTAIQYANQYKNIEIVPSPIEIDVSYEIDGLNVSAFASVEMLENITTINNRILFLVTYDFQDLLYGDFFAKVVRYNEQNFGLTEAGESDVFTTEIVLDAAWELDRLNIVVIIQSFSSSSKIIHQAGLIKLDTHLPHLLPPRNLVGEYHDEIAPYSIDLNWDEPLYTNTTLLGYKVYKDNIYILDEMLIPEITFFTDFDIEPETMYYYHITAVYSHGESIPSNFVDIYTDKSVVAPILGPPKNLQGYDQQDPNTKFLLWEAPVYENSIFLAYKIYRNGNVIAELSNITDIFYTDRNISEGGLLVYYVTALYSHAESKPSNYVSLYTEEKPEEPVLGPPLNLQGSVMPSPSFLMDNGQWIMDNYPLFMEGLFIVNLTWETPDYKHTTFINYKVYKNGAVIAEIDNIAEMIFVDEDIFETGELVYFVTAVYTDGESEMSNTYETYIEVSDDDLNDAPVKTTLWRNFPNPFNPETNISFSLEYLQKVDISIYNVRGQLVKKLVNNDFEKGFHSIIWDGKDNNGNNVVSGVYFYQMRADDFVETRRMILLK